MRKTENGIEPTDLDVEMVLQVLRATVKKEGKLKADKFLEQLQAERKARSAHKTDCHCANCRPDLFVGTDLEEGN